MIHCANLKYQKSNGVFTLFLSIINILGETLFLANYKQMSVFLHPFLNKVGYFGSSDKYFKRNKQYVPVRCLEAARSTE